MVWLVIGLAPVLPDATVYGTDINDDALALTGINAELKGANMVIPCRSKLLDGSTGASTW